MICHHGKDGRSVIAAASIPFLTDCHGGNDSEVIFCSHVPKRPTLAAPKFGHWLELRRGGLTLGQVVNKVRPFVRDAGLKVDPSLIHRYEAGRVPNWPMLIAFSRIYGISIEETVLELVRAIEVRPGQRLANTTEIAVSKEDSAHPHISPDQQQTSGDQDLPIPADGGPADGETALAETRAALERIRAKYSEAFADLATVIDSLPGGQAAVDRPPRSEVSASHRGSRQRSDRARRAKAASKRR